MEVKVARSVRQGSKVSIQCYTRTRDLQQRYSYIIAQHKSHFYESTKHREIPSNHVNYLPVQTKTVFYLQYSKQNKYYLVKQRGSEFRK